jgi:hypothetical protein
MIKIPCTCCSNSKSLSKEQFYSMHNSIFQPTYKKIVSMGGCVLEFVAGKQCVFTTRSSLK